MSRSSGHVWLHRYALATAAAALALVGIGGLVTSHGVGMSVPDWPTSYGYNMFFFPISKWVGGIFYEHSHRLVASFVGVLVVGLTRWLGGRRSRLPLAIIGLAEVLGGLVLLQLGQKWDGAGHFLSGIGGVVLLGALVWARNEPAQKPLPVLGWIAFWAVQVQGLLGGLRVVLFKAQIGIFHAALAQLFFALLCVIALMTSRFWQGQGGPFQTKTGNEGIRRGAGPALAWLFAGATVLIFTQLVLGATMRHQHAGLSIPDFPLAYGKLWPAMDASSIAAYNEHRMEISAVNPITATQVLLQMIHRIVAVGILGLVALCAWRTRRVEGPATALSRWSLCWLMLILVQVLLGAATIWSNKAADIATAHVVTGALALAFGCIQCAICFREIRFALRPATVRAETSSEHAWDVGDAGAETGFAK